MRSPKAKIGLKDSFKVTTLLNTSTESNVITKKLMEDTNLAVRQGPS